MDGTSPGQDWCTIDQLAFDTGLTVRNVRAYQARGLLPPPEVRSRTGWYGPEHRARLELIRDLQGEGVKLDSIKKLLDVTDGSTEQVLNFTRAVRQLFSHAGGAIVDPGELSTRFGSDDRDLLKRALRLGMLRKVGDEQYEEVHPRLSQAGQALVELGVPMDRTLELASALRRHADGIAKLCVELYLDEVWRPFDAAGRPDEEWPAVHATVRRLRAITGDAVLALIEIAVGDRLDVAFGKEITRNVRAVHVDHSGDGALPAAVTTGRSAEIPS